MSFAAVRHTLFTVHMWVGLILGVLLAALGLSGSMLVYDDMIAEWIAPAPHATTAGQPLPLSMIAGIARDAAADQGVDGGAMQIIVPQNKDDAVVVRFNGLSPMGAQMAGNQAAGNGERRNAGSGSNRRARSEGAGAPGRGLQLYLIRCRARCWQPASPQFRPFWSLPISCMAIS